MYTATKTLSVDNKMDKGMSLRIGQKTLPASGLLYRWTLMGHWIKYQHDEQQTTKVI